MMKDPLKAPKACEWTREKTATLISLYQSHQCLWNNFIEAYKNKDKRIKAIESICSQLNISKVDFGKKIHNLRNQFNAEMKKLDKRNESSTEVYRSRWEHYDALKFLREVIAPRPGFSMTFKGPRKYEIKYSMVEEEDDNQPNASEIQDITDTEIHYEEATEADQNALEFSNIPVVSREEILETKYQRPSVDDLDTQEYIQTVQTSQQRTIHQERHHSQEILQIDDSRSMHTAAPPTIVGMEAVLPKKRHRIPDNSEEVQRDQWDVFGEFVAGEFRNLNSELSRKKLKRKIMQVMLEVGEEDDGININISLN